MGAMQLVETNWPAKASRRIEEAVGAVRQCSVLFRPIIASRWSPPTLGNPLGPKPPQPCRITTPYASRPTFHPQSTISGCSVNRLYRSVVPHLDTPRI